MNGKVNFFGTTITETRSAFRPHLGSKRKQEDRIEQLKAIVRIIISFVLLGLSIYLLLKNENKEIASSIIGGIIGYWLK